MIVQRLGPSHVESYRDLMLEAYTLQPDSFTSKPEERAEHRKNWWQERLKNDPKASRLVIGALDGAELCGVVGLSFGKRWKVRHKAKVYGLYVPESYRGLGLGRRLMEAVLTEAKSRPDLKIVQLTVTQGNLAAERLYQSAGFVAFGTEPYAVAVNGGYLNKVHLWRKL